MIPATPWEMPRLVGGDIEVTITPRQADVLSGICQGHTTAQIGRRLYLSEDTVKTHVKRLFRAMNVHCRAHAAALAASGQMAVMVRDDITDWSTT